jgi:hypothetical protein
MFPVENSFVSIEIIDLRTGVKYYKSFVDDRDNIMFAMFKDSKKTVI